ncbi:MAG: Rid family detoxifying hydrolase [Pseudomonadales bacterium]
MKRQKISSKHAPEAIGSYSQAIASDNLLFVSGQLPFDPVSMQIVAGGIEAQARQAFDNVRAVANAAGAELDDALKINLSMIDLAGFASVNAVMAEYFTVPYPARACVQVAALPKDALIEIEAIIRLPDR